MCRDVGPDSFSGLARASLDLAAGLAKRDHRVSIISGAPIAGGPGALGDVAVVPVEPNAGVDPESALGQLLHAVAVHRQVAELSRDHPVDAVIAPLWRSEGAVCLLDDRMTTVVSCMTSLTTLAELDPGLQSLPDLAERLALERGAMRSARYLHGLTTAVLEKTIADHQLAPDATSVIGRGLSDRSCEGSQPAGGPKLRAGDLGLNVLFVGRLEHRKGVDVLLSAARQLIEAGIPLTFTLAGPNADPTFRAGFERDTADAPAVRSSVRFTGEVSDRELGELYRQADIVCAPSRYESHGVVLLEAMMFGKPIVACDAGGVSEVVTAGHDAILCPPDQPDRLAATLRELAASPARRAALGAAARGSYERRFSADVAAERMETFLDLVVPAPPHRIGGAGLDTSLVSTRLQALVQDVFQHTTPAARELVRELLAEPTLKLAEPGQTVRQQVRGVALATPPQRSVSALSTGPRVTAVILSNDLPVLAVNALDSIARCGLAVQTLVLDNGSPPAAAAILIDACAGRERTELRRVERDLGCAGGRRHAVEFVDTEYVLFLDDDAELMPFALAHLVNELDSWPEAAAVTATVVNADGRVYHSGGSLHVTDVEAEFSLYGNGVPLAEVDLPPTGEAGWVPGTAVLIRRSVLQEFPIDPAMTTYYEDNEWCYRVELVRPGSFRRSRESLVFHRFIPRDVSGTDAAGRGVAVQLLSAGACFYRRHGVLLSPALFEIVDELQVPGGVRDLAGARLLMELMSARGPEWMLAAWTAGDLDGLLSSARRAHELEGARHALAELTQALNRSNVELARSEAELRDIHARVARDVAFLQLRHEMLTRIEEGGWWRLRGYLLPLLRLVGPGSRRLNRG